MSYSTLHVFNQDGEMYDYVEYGNSWHGAMLIWMELAKKYGISTDRILFDMESTKEIWKIADNVLADTNDRIVMATTFDRAVVYKEDFPRLVAAMREVAKCLPAHCHVAKQAEDIEKLLGREDVSAIGWTGTSVAPDTWYSGEIISEEESAPYNLNKHDRHWDLFTIFDTDLYEKCKLAVGKHVKYKGTNGDETSPYHGESMEGEGFCTEYHDSHGLCIIVRDAHNVLLCIDPTEVTY